MSLHDEIYDEIWDIIFEDKGSSFILHNLVKEIRMNSNTCKELLEESENERTITEVKTGELKLFGFPLIIDEEVDGWEVHTK